MRGLEIAAPAGGMSSECGLDSVGSVGRAGELWRDTFARRCSVSRNRASSSCSCCCPVVTVDFLQPQSAPSILRRHGQPCILLLDRLGQLVHLPQAEHGVQVSRKGLGNGAMTTSALVEVVVHHAGVAAYDSGRALGEGLIGSSAAMFERCDCAMVRGGTGWYAMVCAVLGLSQLRPAARWDTRGVYQTKDNGSSSSVGMSGSRSRNRSRGSGSSRGRGSGSGSGSDSGSNGRRSRRRSGRRGLEV